MLTPEEYEQKVREHALRDQGHRPESAPAPSDDEPAGDGGGESATLKDGQRQVGKFAEVPSQPDAAKLLNVSERSVRTAAKVRDEGVPELSKAVLQTWAAGAGVA